jgi:hypothetical protein
VNGTCGQTALEYVQLVVTCSLLNQSCAAVWYGMVFYGYGWYLEMGLRKGPISTPKLVVVVAICVCRMLICVHVCVV